MPASDRSKAACYAFQKGECERGDACHYSHDSPAGKGGKGGKAGKGGKGGKGAQTPVNLGEATIMTELKKPESMESTGSLVFFAITQTTAGMCTKLGSGNNKRMPLKEAARLAVAVTFT